MKAVITGASSGIGMEIAKYLAELKYETVLVGRNVPSLEVLRNELGEAAIIEVVDITDVCALKSLFDMHKDADVIVNCAGIGVFGEFDRTELDRELEMIDVNIRALHILTKLYYTEFVKRGSGRILNVSSSAAYFVGPAFSSYYASKAYVNRLTKALARESERCGYGVCLTLFCPGPVKTAFGKRDGISDGLGAITARNAAHRAIDGMLKNKEVVYSDLKTAILVAVSKFFPEKLMSRIVYKQQLKKANNTALPLVKK